MDPATIPNGRCSGAGDEKGIGSREIDGAGSSSDQRESMTTASMQYYGETTDEQVEITDEIVDTNEKKRNPEYRVELGNDLFKEDEISPRVSPENQEHETYVASSG